MWFTLLLSGIHGRIADKHVPMYVAKGLLTRVESAEEAASALGVDPSVFTATLSQYEADAAAGYVPLRGDVRVLLPCVAGVGVVHCVGCCAWVLPRSQGNRRACPPLLSTHSFRFDSFGKKVFPNPVYPLQGPFYLGTVTPTLHYCMGGLRIDNDGHVLAAPSSPSASIPGAGVPIPGLFAAGEVVGGIHGNNRLAGNALTECVVFGRIAARTLYAEISGAQQGQQQHQQQAPLLSPPSSPPTAAQAELPVVSAAQLRENDGKNGHRLWSAIHG